MLGDIGYPKPAFTLPQKGSCAKSRVLFLKEIFQVDTLLDNSTSSFIKSISKANVIGICIFKLV